jgi:hypothetical protein
VHVTTPEAIAEAALRCQARPKAARPGFRDDMLCANAGNSVVHFEALDVPVCKLHEATFTRWGLDADDLARTRWGWGAWSVEAAAAIAVVAQLILNGV